MYAEHFFILLSAVLVIAFASQAWRNGVVGMLWGITGALAGIVGGILLFNFVISGLTLSFGVKLAIAFVAGLVIYLIVRSLAKAVLMALFEPDGPLSWLADGFGGAVVSLVPSLLTVLILAMGLRIGGTLVDLRRFELLVTPGREFPAKIYPARPLVAEWRDGLESLPYVRDGLDFVEPIGRVQERNLVGLLIVSKKAPLFRHLSEDPESKSIVESPVFQALLANETVKELNSKGDRLGMLRHPDVRAAAIDSGLRPALAELELSRLVDEFMLSPNWQQVIEGYQRTKEDTAGPEPAK
ncbi:MAG: hypothetical protein KDM64_10690 [Verrucomicrobiae bacterium]|nr:hypothetical protein [Verrucomicrobiae bacterium]